VGTDDHAGLAGYDEYEPSPDLQPFVRRFLHGFSQRRDGHTLTIPPSGGMFLSYVDGDPLHAHFSDRSCTDEPRLFVGGQLQYETPRLECRGHFGLIGTEFTPTGFHRLFHLDAARFTDTMTDFHAVASDAAALEANLAAAADVPARVGILGQYLCDRVPAALDAPVIERAVDYLNAERGMVRVTELARHCALSTRQLQREFRTVVGLGPKHFAKIVQVNAVFAGLAGADPGSLHSSAVDCGYYDQAHFIRDFRRFIGTNPMGFLRDDEPFLRTYLGKAW
jgi:AraC-like DNA-binding protein